MSLVTTRREGTPVQMISGDETTEEVLHIHRVFEKDAAYFIWTSDAAQPGYGWVVFFVGGTCAPQRVQVNAGVKAVRSLS
jgi:hypothetical protein